MLRVNSCPCELERFQGEIYLHITIELYFDSSHLFLHYIFHVQITSDASQLTTNSKPEPLPGIQGTTTHRGPTCPSKLPQTSPSQLCPQANLSLSSNALGPCPNTLLDRQYSNYLLYLHLTSQTNRFQTQLSGTGGLVGCRLKSHRVGPD